MLLWHQLATSFNSLVQSFDTLLASATAPWHTPPTTLAMLLEHDCSHCAILWPMLSFPEPPGRTCSAVSSLSEELGPGNSSKSLPSQSLHRSSVSFGFSWSLLGLPGEEDGSVQVSMWTSGSSSASLASSPAERTDREAGSLRRRPVLLRRSRERSCWSSWKVSSSCSTFRTSLRMASTPICIDKMERIAPL